MLLQGFSHLCRSVRETAATIGTLFTDSPPGLVTTTFSVEVDIINLHLAAQAVDVSSSAIAWINV
jgi:hypothetical protein